MNVEHMQKWFLAAKAKFVCEITQFVNIFLEFPIFHGIYDISTFGHLVEDTQHLLRVVSEILGPPCCQSTYSSLPGASNWQENRTGLD